MPRAEGGADLSSHEYSDAGWFLDESEPDTDRVPGAGVELQVLLDEMLALRGATAAALVTQEAEVIASRSHDRALLERTVAVITSALAAGQALGELFDVESAASEDSDDGEPGERDAVNPLSQVTMIFGEGPILLTLLPVSSRVMVLALSSERDLGRARLHLKGRLGRLADAALAGRTGNLEG